MFCIISFDLQLFGTQEEAHDGTHDSYCFCKPVPLNLDWGHEDANYFYVDSSLLI